MRPTFYTGRTLCEIICKPKDRITAKGKNNIVQEIVSNNCKTIQLGESKRYLKIDHIDLPIIAIEKRMKL